ncbi:MAG: hypothetical protein Q9212_006599, partial [Teloschistes hypoglaucus]
MLAPACDEPLFQLWKTLSALSSFTLGQVLRSTLVISVLLPLCRFVHRDYAAFIALGPGGTPKTPFGYLRISYLRLFTLKDPLTPPPCTAADRPAQGFLVQLPKRPQPRPSDSSMHLTLHPEDAALVISRGWGERHPLAGCPVLGIGKRLLPEGFVMVYAPQDEKQIEVLHDIVRAAGCLFTMSKNTKYLLVSLPASISRTNDHDEALTALRSAVTTDYGTVFPFSIPEFKIGTLDALVQQADELAKLETGCEGVVGKVGDSLKTILEGDESKISKHKTVNDKPAEQYLKSFHWNKVKYRADKPLGEIISILQKEITSIDNQVKDKYNSYNQVKTNLTALQRRQTGNLATKSLISVVPPSLVIRDSDYLETHLIVVPLTLTKDFLRTYETIAPFVVPRSAQQITTDDEFALYA